LSIKQNNQRKTMGFLDKIVGAISAVLENLRPPAFELPPWLLWCTAIRRDGMSSMRTTTRQIADLRNLGWDVSKNADGTTNRLVQLLYAVNNGIMQELKQHGVVKTAICTGQIQFMGTGANGGGPVTVNGININCVNTSGLIE
jgi:hypothetical protein